MIFINVVSARVEFDIALSEKSIGYAEYISNSKVAIFSRDSVH